MKFTILLAVIFALCGAAQAFGVLTWGNTAAWAFLVVAAYIASALEPAK